MSKYYIAPIVLAFSLGTTCRGDIRFFDGTLNSGDYSQTIYNSNPAAISFTISQCGSCGNPGSALDLNYVFGSPTTTSFVTLVGDINNGWVYNPSTQGAIAGLDFSVDKYLATPAVVTTNSAIPLLYQNGNFYLDFIFGATATNQFNTIGAGDLQASDFELVDFSNGTFDASINPNFSSTGGPIDFGTAVRFQLFDFSGGPYTSEIRLDNLSYTITPEPNSVWLALALLSPLVMMATHRRKRDRKLK